MATAAAESLAGVGRLILVILMEAVPPGKHSSLNLSCWHVLNTQEILNSAHSALLSVFTYDHLSPAASGHGLVHDVPL